MSVFLELAAAVHTKSLTLFVGTGFSKFMTNNAAPSWTELLVDSCRNIDSSGELFDQFFNIYDNGEVLSAKYELQIVAQILELEYRKVDKNFKEAISEIIKSRINEETIDKEKLSVVQDFFVLHPEINIVTTNYDTLFSEFIIPNTTYNRRFKLSKD